MAYKVVKLVDGANQTIGFATVSQDVTNRKRLEDNLRILATDLAETDRRRFAPRSFPHASLPTA